MNRSLNLRLATGLLLAVSTAPIFAAAPTLRLEQQVAGEEVYGAPNSLSVYLYPGENDHTPLKVQHFRSGEWAVESSRKDSIAGGETLRIAADFTATDGLEQGQTVYAEMVVDGSVVGQRVAARVPGPPLQVDGIIQSKAGGIQFPDGTVQTTAATAGTIANNSVTTNMLQNGAVTAPKLGAMGATIGQVLGYSGTAWGPVTPAGGDNLGNHTATQALNMSFNKIGNLAAPTVAGDAVNKGYVDGAVNAAAAGAGVPSGAVILTGSSIPPSGYTYLGDTMTADPRWEAKAPMPTARAGLAAAVLDGRLYAVGGVSATSLDGLATNEAYDPTTNSWSAKAPMPTARRALAAAALDGRLYAVGGLMLDGATYVTQATNEAYDPTTNTWTARAPMPTARSQLAAAALDGRLYAVGGANDLVLATNEAYDPVTNSWTAKAPMSTMRIGLAAAALGGQIYAVGGLGGGYLATNEAYDPTTNSWTPQAPMPTARLNLAAAVLDGQLYMVGGEDESGLLATNEAYSPTTNSWTAKAPMPTACWGLAAAALGARIYAVGGYNDTGGGFLHTNTTYGGPGKVFHLHQKN